MSNYDYVQSDESESNVKVTINVNVTKIVQYVCIAGVLIVAIVAAAKQFKKTIDTNLLED